jgi:hypothetical protein
MTPKPEPCKEHLKLAERVARMEGKLSILIGLNVVSIVLIAVVGIISR